MVHMHIVYLLLPHWVFCGHRQKLKVIKSIAYLHIYILFEWSKTTIVGHAGCVACPLVLYLTHQVCCRAVAGTRLWVLWLGGLMVMGRGISLLQMSGRIQQQVFQTLGYLAPRRGWELDQQDYWVFHWAWWSSLHYGWKNYHCLVSYS